MRSGASGFACLDASFAASAMQRSRVPIVFDPFHDCAFCERAAPDAPETIDDQRRCTGCRDRTIYGGLARERIPTVPAKRLGPITPTVLSRYPKMGLKLPENGK